MEENQRRGQLLRVAFASLSCSLAPSPCIFSPPHLALPFPFFCVFSLFLFVSLSLSLCCSLYRSGGFRQRCPFPSFTLWWRDGLWGEGGDEAMEAFRTGKHTLPSLCCHLLLPVNIIVINYLLSACQPSKHYSWLVVTLKGQSVKITEKHIFFSCFIAVQIWRYQFRRFLSLWRWMEFCLWCTENWKLLPEQMSTVIIGLPFHLETISTTKSKGNSKAGWLWRVTRVVVGCTKHKTSTPEICICIQSVYE